jgi:DNA mismatch endonuclease, patch repair protein
MDKVDSLTRSRIMASVRGKNTKPEVILRKALFAYGFRFRICSARLPGKPDLVFPKYKAVIFVHGCLWHWHGCSRSRMPTTNVEYWTMKIARNQERDSEQVAALLELGWRVLIIWECTIKAQTISAVANLVADWIRDSDKKLGTVEFSRQKGGSQHILINAPRNW